jgi:sulfatase modifying factor 1
MHGNVWEWTYDVYEADYYLRSPEVDPLGPSNGASRVFRGGSWYVPPDYGRAAYRRRSAPTSTYFFLGLRLARDS